MNDIYKGSSLKLLCFANDTTAYLSGPNVKDLTTDVNVQLKQLCCILSLNINTTYYTLFRPTSSAPFDSNDKLLINEKTIQRVGETNGNEAIKFIGLYIDNHLTWNQHVNYLCSALSKCLFFLNRAKHFLPHSALKSLYFALIQSRLQYGIEAWGNSICIHKLAIIQKRAIRIINKIPHRHHTDPLFKSNGIIKFTDLYKLHVYLFMFDLTHRQLPVSFDGYITMGNETNYNVITRQHYLLYKTRPRNTLSSKLPSHKFANIWNHLDQTLQRSNSKIKLKLLLRKLFTDTYLSIVHCENERCAQCFGNIL